MQYITDRLTGHAPKRIICYGIPDFPNGIEVTTYIDQVFGQSLDKYIFIEMNRAPGIYYFETNLQDPDHPNSIEGTVTDLDAKDWNHRLFKIKCTVEEWHKN